MLLTLDLSDPRPLHEQVATAVRRAIVESEIRPGDRLPPARDIAAALGVNVNTVLRALRELRDEGLVEFRRGRGISVVGAPDPRGVLLPQVRELLDNARRYGLQPKDVIALIEEAS
ncbi:GntR family transcriptional regulator [Thermasporomyces composti]|jgi:GntR family transcriptional regulator|uniref:GntR family transcriptional regulator n=1 Tax=Thermasporomyces composti TaxID=696763 RepID=A0A3D9V674_THECX|nr:GntR family transcriptional regulator [Thermasporomyces composti]REF36846.1 GntR family transcriptional regulator [Thermasporomyces composti]